MHFEHCGAGDAIFFIHGMPVSGGLWLQERYISGAGRGSPVYVQSRRLDGC